MNRILCLTTFGPMLIKYISDVLTRDDLASTMLSLLICSVTNEVVFKMGLSPRVKGLFSICVQMVGVGIFECRTETNLES